MTIFCAFVVINPVCATTERNVPSLSLILSCHITLTPIQFPATRHVHALARTDWSNASVPRGSFTGFVSVSNYRGYFDEGETYVRAYLYICTCQGTSHFRLCVLGVLVNMLEMQFSILSSILSPLQCHTFLQLTGHPAPLPLVQIVST